MISKLLQIVDGTSSDFDLAVALLYGRNKQNSHTLEFKLEDGTSIFVDPTMLCRCETDDIPGVNVWFVMGYGKESLKSQIESPVLLSDEDRKVSCFYSTVTRSGVIEPGWNGFICPPYPTF